MNKINLKFKKLFITIILIIFILGLCFSIYKIITYKMDENKINKQLDLIDNAVKVSDVNDTSKVEIIKQDEITESDPYWYYINMNLIDVDFSKLKSINKNTKGWIKVNGTNINYPFVQTDNNDYYLNHSFDNSYNYAGWVFLDYRNNISNFDNKNTIIYAHGMYNNTMFGSLRNILTNGWLDDTNNYIIKLSTEKENNIYVITNNAVVDDEIDYSIYGVATDINEAKKLFNQAVKDVKTDSDFDNLNAIEENSPNFKNNDGEWIYSESDDSFELWCNGEYNSNNYSIQIKKYELDKETELSDAYEL